MSASRALDYEFHSAIVDRTWFVDGETMISVFLVLGIGLGRRNYRNVRAHRLRLRWGKKRSNMTDRFDSIAEGGVVRVTRCVLSVAPEAWPFAARHAEEIAAHWEKRRSFSPKLYDGAVHLLRTCTFEHNVFTATLLRTDFKSFLYWRELGYPDAGVRDGFGSAVIRSAEGHVMLGRQTEGNVNQGLAYPPSGFIDEHDVCGEVIDIDAGTARELREETGLKPEDLARAPGYLVTTSGPHVSIAVEWRSALGSDALKACILEYVRQQQVPELADVVIVRSRSDISAHTIPDYAKVLLRALLAA